MHLSLEISQGVPGTGESRNPHKPKPPKAAEAAKGTQEMMTVHCAGRERDPLPASVFGRVRLTSCQINIYSQIYLFAFVIENSCGLFFSLSLCVVCALFCSPCVFLAAQCWHRGGAATAFPGSSSPSSCFSQPVLNLFFSEVGPAWQLCPPCLGTAPPHTLGLGRV